MRPREVMPHCRYCRPELLTEAMCYRHAALLIEVSRAIDAIFEPPAPIVIPDWLRRRAGGDER
jgi:hypothetical protein